MDFTGFSKESISFLQEIRQNNTKEWFEANRDRYEALIKEPSVAYVNEMGEHLQALVPTIKAKPKVNGSLFRIYRDIRFSKDKTPIKSRIGIIFWQGAGKRMQSSSFYMHFSPAEIFFAVGIRGFSRDTLSAYREYIKDESHAYELDKILKDIKSKGYKIPEPKYKRVPREFDDDYIFRDLARYDAIYAYKEIAPNDILFSEKLVDYAYDIYEDLLPLQQWVYEMTLTVEVDTI
jgi:uncharacterized protein (TIGR02453 family)